MNLFPHILMRIGGIPFEKLDVLCLDVSLFEEIHQSIETLQDDVELENKFNQELIRIRENIKELSKETALRNGLLLSAPSVLDRISSYQKKEIADFRKKEKQTERTIVQYLTRIATKTSPFSTFNQIGLAEIKEQPSLIKNAELISNQSFVRINNYILKSFKDSIVQDRTLVQGLRIVVNSTLTRLENGYEFLVNDNNIEAFQTIGEHPVVQLILEKLESGKGILFSELINKLLEDVDAEKGELENFVLELHEVGLLEFEIRVSNLDANWELKCLDLLEVLPKCQLSVDWMTLLLQLQEAKQKYPRLRTWERRILLKKALIRFNSLFEEINQGVEKTEQTIFKKQFDNQLVFNEMNLLYEDYAVESETSVSKKNIETLLNKIDAFIKVLEPFQRNNEMEELTYFFKENYTNKVDLLTFYKAFVEWKLSNNIKNNSDNDFNEPFQKWKLALKKTIVIKNDIANIEIGNLQNRVLNKKEKPKSHSVFVQLYQNGNEFHCFLNSVMPGYGKYFSRFLHLFPEKVTKELKERNNRTNQFFAEINDNSFFNANIHPSLMPYEIKLLDENTQVSKSRELSLKDIYISLVNDKLKLIDKRIGREIVPFDLGFLALAGRSELFKLLSHFSEATFSPVHQVINVINDLVSNQNKIQVFPRIVIENRITIQRKTWIIPKLSIPKPQQKHETEWTLYKRVLNWMKENNLPLEGFYTINSKELAKNKDEVRNTDAYKPQYVNFNNPILVQLFIRSCKKIETSLKLVEMLPDSSDLLTWNDEKYVSEFLFQWNS
jgi:hypothetical protein